MHQSGGPPWNLCLIAMLEERSHIIGHDGSIPWGLSLAFSRFKQLTRGHPIIIGRISFEQWGYAITGSEIIVVSFFKTKYLNGAHKVCSSYYEARDYAIGRSDKVFVAGGEGLFREALRDARTLYLTIVEHAGVRGDRFFPNYQENFRIVDEEPHAEGDYAFKFATLERS
ncbi:dihydrofolate reductase [Candidatus Parcubacteria bacterium]|nr:dihydrofolate reductase [Candidatus Parcubacteria bacterium]